MWISRSQDPSYNYKEYENLQKTDNTFFEGTSEKFDVIETETEVKIDFFNKQIIFDRNTGKIKAFSDKQKLRDFVASRHSCKKC